VTSRADDFGVHYDDEDASRRGRRGNAAAGPGAGAGGMPPGVDYDLGYADPGWDNQGFRTPAGADPLSNSGPHASGPHNSGAYSSGPYNGGQNSSGAYNSGPNNTGGHNTGGYRSGAHSSGAPRTGPHNSGPYRNSGPYASQPAYAGQPSYESPTQTYRPVDDFGPTPDYAPGPEYAPAPEYGPGPGQDYGQPGQDFGHTEIYSPPGGYRQGEDYDLPGVPSTPPGRRGGGGGGHGGGPRTPRTPRGRGGKVKVKGSWWRHWSVKKALAVMAALVGGFVVLIAIVIAYFYSTTQVPTENMAAVNYQESTVYADNGTTVIGHLGTTDRQIITYNQIPQQIIYSVLSAEDRNFLHEGGISPTGILRAAYTDLTSNNDTAQGGSTITQQFVRNYYQGIGTQQTASRKIKEIFVSMKVAKSESKQWILENYLNTIYLGESSYGIAAAAETYFKIPVGKLSTITWSQSALLAALIQQPTYYPLPQYRANFEQRWQYVRSGLLKEGWITQAQYNAMSFPKFGDYVPQSYGPEVWAPYVMNVVQNELENPQTYHMTQSQLYNGGYKIVTTVDPAKMNALYAAVQAQESVMSEDGESLQDYMHAAAILEDPQTGAIEAMYGGPGFVGSKYNGVGKAITQSLCNKIFCTDNMAVYNQEQVGSSFKPYILATAVSQGMDVKTSQLDGQDFVCIPPDSMPSSYPTTQGYPDDCAPSWYPMSNDSAAENGVFTAQDAMTNSVNTAYADLWHRVGGQAVVDMAVKFGVNAKLSGLNTMVNEAGVALGQASLTVADQATTLATLDDNGIYHSVHIVGSISKGSSVIPLQVTSHPVFSDDLQVNSEMDSQVQYAMEDVTLEGTGTAAEMSDGRQIIAKTGTTNTAQSAFFIGAIPQEALAVALFTNHQSGLVTDPQTINGLGGVDQGDGGTWPAAIWHTYAESEFAQLPIEAFPEPVFTGIQWKLAPASLTKPKPKKKAHKPGSTTGTGRNPSGQPTASPSPTQTCAPGQENVDCNNPVVPSPTATTSTDPTMGATPTPSASLGVPGILSTSPDATATQAGAATAGAVVVLPVTLLWVRRRQYKKPPRRG
jgi:membrane peptidoglycan carboxypeptidase